MEKEKIKLGFAPTRRGGLARLLPEVAIKSKQMIEAKLKEWDVEYVGLDWLNEDGFLYDPIDAPRVAARFKAEGVDALFTPHCNFGTEAAVAILARKVGKPLLLWGPRDGVPEPDGERLQDVQCGLFATTAVLKRMGVPFTYIVNSPVESETFKRGLHSFLCATAAASAFLGARIGQVGTRPPAFWTMIENEGELLERWGIQVVPTTLVEISQAMMEKLKQNSPELKQTVNEFRATADFRPVSEESIARMAALKLVFVEFCQKNKLDALAIYCHLPFRVATGVPECFVNGILSDMGIPVGCETDLHGVLTSLMAQAATLNTQPIIFADLTIRHPENDNAELLWHCGNFPPSLAADPSARQVHQHDGLYAAGSWEVKGGDITIARVGGDHGHYSLFMGEAKGTTGPYTYGTYLWVEMGNWLKWEEKLMYGPYIHHIAAVHGHVAPVLYEACKYIPGLEPDPVEPTAEEIRAYWRGEDLGGR
jgi:L-fucose isomerase-like protein